MGRCGVRGTGADREERRPKRSGSDGRDVVRGAGHARWHSRGLRVPTGVRALAGAVRRGCSDVGPQRANQTQPSLLARRLPRHSRRAIRCPPKLSLGGECEFSSRPPGRAKRLGQGFARPNAVSRCRRIQPVLDSAFSRLSSLNCGQHAITEVQAFPFAHAAVDGESDLPYLNSESA